MWIKDWHGLYRQDSWGEVNLPSSETSFEIGLIKTAIKRADTIIELGAGYGTWCLAATGLRPGIRCIAVEAEPTHYKWLCEAFQYNHINGITINKAAHKSNRRVLFVTGKPVEWYGQTVIDRLWNYYRHVPPWNYRLIPTISLPELIKLATGYIYLNSDIQGSEQHVFDVVPWQIRYMHIATHSLSIHDHLLKHLSTSFRVEVNYPPGYESDTLKLCDGILEVERR